MQHSRLSKTKLNLNKNDRKKFWQSFSAVDYPLQENNWRTLSSTDRFISSLDKKPLQEKNTNEFSNKQTIKEENERTPLVYKAHDDMQYSNVDTLTLSLVPNIQIRDAEHPGISWMSVAFGITNAAIGVGVLNYPQAYDKMGGYEMATFVQLIVVGFLFISMTILIYASDLNKSNSYHEILSSICGKNAEILVAGDIMLATFGICVAYLIVIGDQYDRVFASLIGSDFCKFWYLERKFTITLTALLIIPMCYLKSLDFLKRTGPLGIISMLYVVFLTVYEHFSLGKADKDLIRTRPESISNLLAVVPVVCFGYQCNEVIIPIYASMKDRSMKKFLKAASLSYGALVILYGTVGYFGYSTFGSKVLPDIITMFNGRDFLVIIGIVSLIFKMALTYPQFSFVGRGATDSLINYFGKNRGKDTKISENARRFIVTTIWFFATLLLALFSPDIGVVIEALGTLSAANVFIFPSICLLSLIRNSHYSHSKLQKLFFIILAGILIPIGFSVIILVLFQVYRDISTSELEKNVTLCIP